MTNNVQSVSLLRFESLLFLCNETHIKPATRTKIQVKRRPWQAAGHPCPGHSKQRSWQIQNDQIATLRSGEPLAEALSMLTEKQADAVLINCSWPETVTKALPQLNSSKLKFGAYANGFTAIDKLSKGGTVDVLQARGELSKEVYADHVKQWIAGGAAIIGGCCEISPQHIAYLSQSLIADGHTLTKLN